MSSEQKQQSKQNNNKKENIYKLLSKKLSKNPLDFKMANYHYYKHSEHSEYAMEIVDEIPSTVAFGNQVDITLYRTGEWLLNLNNTEDWIINLPPLTILLPIIQSEQE